MKMHFIEKDLLNHINYIDKEWEIVNPVILKKLYLNYSTLTWNVININNKIYRYTYLSCSTPFQKGKRARVYILCPNEKMFENNCSNIELWNQWADKHFLITTPIFYDKNSKIYTAFDIYSNMVEYRPISSVTYHKIDTYEDSIKLVLQFFINTNCFSIASGFIYYVGLYRSKTIDEYILTNLLEQWVKKLTITNEWNINYENIYDTIVLSSGINTCIGENVLLYALYGNCSESFIKFLFEINGRFEPIYELITNTDTNSPTFYYFTIYSAMIKYYPTSYWKILIPYLDRISLKSYINEIGIKRFTIHKSFTDVVHYLLQLSDEENVIKKMVINFYKEELHKSKNIFVANIFIKSFKIHRNVKLYTKKTLESLWNFLQIHFFNSNLEWSSFIHNYLINTYLYASITLPHWDFFHWIFHSSRKYKLELFNEKCSKEILHINEKIFFKDIYTTLTMFPTFTVPHLFLTYVLKKQIQNTLLSVALIKSHNKSIGDAIEYFLNKNKNQLYGKLVPI